MSFFTMIISWNSVVFNLIGGIHSSLPSSIKGVLSNILNSIRHIHSFDRALFCSITTWQVNTLLGILLRVFFQCLFAVYANPNVPVLPPLLLLLFSSPSLASFTALLPCVIILLQLGFNHYGISGRSLITPIVKLKASRTKKKKIQKCWLNLRKIVYILDKIKSLYLCQWSFSKRTYMNFEL